MHTTAVRFAQTMHPRFLGAVRHQSRQTAYSKLASRAPRHCSAYPNRCRDTSSIQYETSRLSSSSSSTGAGPSSSSSSSSSSGSSNSSPGDNLGHQINFAAPILEVLDFFRRAVKFSLIGVVMVGGTTLAAFEGIHQWVEHRELNPEPDPDGEMARWGWDCDLAGEAKWSGGEEGGTNPALGIKARHAVRGAWMAQHWGPGPDFLATDPINRAQRSEGVVESRLKLVHDFLSIALNSARDRLLDGGLSEQSVADLLAQHAAALERIGSQHALNDALMDYEALWRASGGQDLTAARIAQKLGEVNARLGMGTEALEWWSRALFLVSDTDTVPRLPALDNRLEIPREPPSTPYAQRLLASLLSSLSAHYAQAGRLEDARDVQESGLAMLKSAIDELAPSSLSASPAGSLESTNDMNVRPKTPSETLHILFLQHRASLLVLHAAEVSHALKATNNDGTLTQLTYAASLSEQIASILSTPMTSAGKGTKESKGIGSLLDKYSSSKTLRVPASGLLRDARRTAIHAWTLAGVMHENAASAAVASAEKASNSSSGSYFRKREDNVPEQAAEKQAREHREALLCYERALECAGVRDGRPSENLLESEWSTLWSRYTRARDVFNSSEGASKTS